MSEEILRALMQLFAIITKQDGGVTQKERSYVEDFLKQLVDRTSVLEYLILYDEFSEAPPKSPASWRGDFATIFKIRI